MLLFSALRRRLTASPLAVAWATVVVVGTWMAATTPLVSQEAYYWLYSRHPALSYFDHPPMVAWGIAAGTWLLGDGALGVRLFTLLCAFGTTLIGQLLLRSFGAGKTTCAGWVLLSLGVPMLAAGHVLANPDPPLTLFWIASAYAMWRIRISGDGRWWWAVGLAAGGALLSKYTACFLGLGIALVLLLDPRMRKELKRIGPWLAALIAAICFAPVLLWNWQHDWASFAFQSGHRYEHASLQLGRALGFVLLQALLVSPVLALLLPPAILWTIRRAIRADARAIWLLAFGLPLPLFVAANSLEMHAKANWTMPAVAILTLALIWWLDRKRIRAHWPRLARAGGGTVLATVLACIAAPALDLLPQGRGGSWSGWGEIARHAEQVARRLEGRSPAPSGVFLFGADYKDAAQLARGLALCADNPDRPVLAQNVFGRPALAFDYWTAPERHLGEDAVFVLTRPEQRSDQIDAARRFFDEVERVETVAVRRLGRVVLRADLFECRGYLGPEEPCPDPSRSTRDPQVGVLR